MGTVNWTNKPNGDRSVGTKPDPELLLSMLHARTNTQEDFTASSGRTSLAPSTTTAKAAAYRLVVLFVFRPT